MKACPKDKKVEEGKTVKKRTRREARGESSGILGMKRRGERQWMSPQGSSTRHSRKCETVLP